MKPLSTIAEECAEKMQDCYEYTKAGPNYDLDLGRKMVYSALREAMQQAEPWMRHVPYCPANGFAPNGIRWKCECGLEDFLKQMGKSE